MAKNKTLNNRYRVNPYPGGLTPPPGWNPTANDTPMVERVRRMRQGGGSPLWSGQAVVGKSDPAPQVSVPYRQATMSASAPTVNVPQTRQAVFGTSAPAPTVNVPSGQKTPPQTPPPPAAVPPPVPAPTPPAPGALPSPTPRPPETPTTPPTPDTATKPYELGYYEQQAVQPAMGALQARAAGESPVDRRIANLYLGYLRAGNEAEKAAAAQEMAQLGVSPQAAAARMAMLGQRQGSQEAQTAGQLAVSSQERAAQAAQQLGQLGMQGAGLEQRKHEFGEEMGYKRDVLEEQKEQFDKELALRRSEHEERIRQFNEHQEYLRENAANKELWNQYDAAIQAGDWEGAAAIYEQISGNPIDMSTLKEAEQRNFRNELMPQVKQRINEAMAAGRGFEEITQDQTTRELLADALGVDINNDRIDTELRNMYDAELANDQPAASKNYNQYLASASEKGWSADEVVADEMTWRNAGYSMQLDPYDVANADAIEERIRKDYEVYNKPVIDQLVDAAATDMFPMYTDTPGARADLRQVITDMYTGNKISMENGEMVIKEDAFWPWEDPETMFNYVDWEGGNLDYNQKGELTPDSQQRLQQVTYTTADGQAITQQQAIDKWRGLDQTTRNQYINDDGTINQEAFLESSDGFGTAETQAAGGGVIHTTPEYWDEYIMNNPQAIATFYGAGDDPGVLEHLSNVDMGQEDEDAEDDPTSYAYYDFYGNRTEGRIDDPQMAKIWLQFREAFGQDMTPYQFTSAWNKGDGWIIDANGMVKNFDPQWRKQHDLPEAGTTPYSYRLSSGQMDLYRQAFAPEEEEETGGGETRPRPGEREYGKPGIEEVVEAEYAEEGIDVDLGEWSEYSEGSPSDTAESAIKATERKPKTDTTSAGAGGGGGGGFGEWWK